MSNRQQYKMKTQNIHGKLYIGVHERLKRFRAEYPEHDMSCEIHMFDGKQILIKYIITTGAVGSDRYRVHATGVAHEVLGSSNINKTSFVENCDTSAVGRCLGNFGIGIDEAYASANEIINATNGNGSDGKGKPKGKVQNNGYRGPYQRNNGEEKEKEYDEFA